jgi:hypothetical protein
MEQHAAVDAAAAGNEHLLSGPVDLSQRFGYH